MLNCPLCQKPFEKKTRNHTYCTTSCRNKAERDRYLLKTYDEVTRRKASGCAQCPEKRPWCLHFHHIDPSTKVGEVNRMRRSFCPDIVRKEMDKCILLCANCHADVEYWKLHKKPA